MHCIEPLIIVSRKGRGNAMAMLDSSYCDISLKHSSKLHYFLSVTEHHYLMYV